MKVALDTNLLVYLDSSTHDPRREEVSSLLRRIPADQIVVPVQVLAEYVRVLVYKQGYPLEEARQLLLVWIETYATVKTSAEIVLAAADLSADHRIAHWDAIVLASAASAGCRLLLSEDMHDGFNWAGLTVVDPFQRPRHPLLSFLDDASPS